MNKYKLTFMNGVTLQEIIVTAYDMGQAVQNNQWSYGTLIKAEIAGYAPVELDSCAQCGADPKLHCSVGRSRGREPHDLDGSWIKCGACGNTITVYGRQAVKRARLAWNIRA